MALGTLNGYIASTFRYGSNLIATRSLFKFLNSPLSERFSALRIIGVAK